MSSDAIKSEGNENRFVHQNIADSNPPIVLREKKSVRGKKKLPLALRRILPNSGRKLPLMLRRILPNSGKPPKLSGISEFLLVY